MQAGIKPRHLKRNYNNNHKVKASEVVARLVCVLILGNVFFLTVSKETNICHNHLRDEKERSVFAL